MAPGTLRTLRELTNPEKRPAFPLLPMDPDLDAVELAEQINLDPELLIKNLRTARRAAARGPSGMTAEHLRPLLESDRDVAVFHQFAHIMARGEVPDKIEEAIRLGRITALRKPDGGVRGIVVADFLRRLVVRTIAKQIAKQVEVATAQWQYALTTRTGCECVVHVLQHLTDGDAQATILSVDGIGAFDLVSRNAMLQGLMGIEDGGKVLPFVRTFYGQPSNFIWEDEMGDVHDIPQGEGGEQGDPLMSLLFCLAQHAALRAVADQMEEGEHLFAFLDDLYIVCHPDRVGEIHSILQREFRHAHISIHPGKTKIWNRSGDEPEACARLQAVAFVVNQSAVVWRSHPPSVLPRSQNLRVSSGPPGSRQCSVAGEVRFPPP